MNRELPTLPRAVYSLDLSDGFPTVAYSAQQMYDFANAALAASKAEPAEPVCDIELADDLAKLGWQTVFCDLCGHTARGFPQAEPAEDAALAERSYVKGWIQAAKWADRVDLISDIGSSAFERDMKKNLGKDAERKSAAGSQS